MKLLPYEQLVIARELDRLRAEEKSAGGSTGDRSVSKTDIEKLRENFAGILTGKVTVE